MRGLYSVKPWFVRRLRRVEDLLVARRVSPDRLTAAAVVVSILCGAVLALGGAVEEPGLWLLVPPLAVVRLALNALDGSLARRTGSGRPFGEVMNEMGDRAADAAMLAPLGLVVSPALALGALSAALFASAAGLLGSAVAGARLSGGPMGKVDRVAVLACAAPVAALAATPQLFVIALWLILVGSIWTAVIRVVSLARTAGGER